MYHKLVTVQSLMGKLKGAHDWILPRIVSDVSFIISEISGESQLTVALEKLNKVTVTQNSTAMATVKFNDFSLEKVFCLYGMLLGSIRWGCKFPKESCRRGGRSGNCIIIQTVPKSNPIFVSLFIQNVSDFKHAYPYQWTCFIPPREIKNI